jgi:hypothetical protein
MSAGLAVFLFSTTTRDNTSLMILLAIYLLVVGVRAVQGHRFALIGSALFFLGLTVHLIMIIRAGADPEPFINQTAPDTFKTMMTVIRREQYPPINPFERRAPLLWQYGYYYGFLFKQFYFLGPGLGMLTTVTTVLGPIFLALVGLFQGLRRLFPLILVPLTNYLFNGEILTLYLNFTSSEVRDRDYFYFAAFMFFAIFIGLGASALMRYMAGGEGKSAAEADEDGTDWRTAIPRVKITPLVKLVAVVLVVISLLPITPGHTKFFEHDNSDNWIAYEYAWNILAGLDENAIVFTNGDNDTFPIWYLQEVEKFRTDVTVVNLSLVNLPWYVKQLRNSGEKPLAMQRGDKEIDDLKHRVFEDPQTGERTVLMIKDYVVHDIITTNHADRKLPVFFAVTIPTENMERYFPNLQMEGMAYRLMDEASPEGVPTTDANKVMENMLGVYRVGALMDGDTPERNMRYREMVGLATDTNLPPFARGNRRLGRAEMDTLSRLYGKPRDDVFRNTNARHLLGNYPAAFNRAGYEYYLRANQARDDTLAYRQNIRLAITAFEAGLNVAPFNDLAMDYYPLLLVQDYRDQDAKDFLTSLSGNVPPEVEERVVVSTIRGIVGGGVPQLAVGWISERIEAQPDRAFYYRLQFQIFQAMGDFDQAKNTADTWERRSGEKDPDMERGLAEMRQRSLDREQGRIDEALEKAQEPGEADGQ